MGHILSLTPDQYETIRAHLLDREGEQVAFLFASTRLADAGVLFTATGIYLCDSEDYDHESMYHVELTEEAQARVIKSAWDRRCALVELHCHPLARLETSENGGAMQACFSPYDACGLPEFASHVQWRLKGQPYAALVFGEEDFDALVWTQRGGLPEPLDRIEVGKLEMRPTGRTLASATLVQHLTGVRKC